MHTISMGLGRRATSTKSESIFVDRQDYIDMLRELAERAHAERRPYYVFIDGAAGIGKTTILEHFTKSTFTDKPRILQVNPFEGIDQPLLPFADAVREFYKKYKSVSNKIAKLVWGFVGCVPEIGPPIKNFGDAIIEARGMSDLDKYETNQTALFSKYSQLIEEMSKNKLLIVCVDDAHWLDKVSLDLLMYCINKNKKSGTLFVISSRATGANESERSNLKAINELCERLKPRSLQITVKSLSKLYCGELMKRFSDTTRLNQKHIDKVYNATRGNPYFIRWALMRPAGQRIPNDIQGMLENTLREVYSDMPNSKEVIRYAAVLGSRFDIDTLAGLLSMKRTDVFDMLTELHQKYNIVVNLGNGTTFAFEHDNMRNAVCDGIHPTISDYHRDVAKFLERSGASNPYVLAYHYSHTDSNEKTLHYMKAAATTSKKFFMDASERLKRCLVIAQDMCLKNEDILTIKVDYADSLLEKADVESSKAILESVLSEITDLKLKVRARILLSKCYRMIGTHESGEEAIENARIATSILDDNSEDAGDAYAYLSTVIDHFRSNDAETRRAYTKAIKCYQRYPEKLAQLQRKSGMILEPRHAIRTMRGSLMTFKKYDMQIETARCCNNIGAEYFYIGDFENAVLFLRRSLEDFRKLGTYQADVPLNNMGLYYLNRGEYDKAKCCFNDALEHPSETFNAIFIRMNLSTVYRKEGCHDRAMHVLLDLEDSVMNYAEPTLCDYYGFNRAMAHRELEDWAMTEEWLYKFPVNTYKNDHQLAEAKRMSAMHVTRNMQGMKADSYHATEEKIKELFNTQRPQKWFYKTDYYPCDIHIWD